MGFVAVVEVGGVVADFVGQIDKLSFERRTLVEEIFREFRDVSPGRNRASV